MPISVSRLKQQFTVSSVDKVYKTDTFINVIKRREEILYRNILGAQSANIAYIGSDPITSSTNLSIADRSTSLAANRVREVDATTVTGTKIFTIDTENFVVTDVFTDESQTIAALPLFYKHELKNVDRDVNGNLDTGVTLVSAELLDSYLQTVNIPELKVDYDQGIIYNNLLHEYNSSSDFLIYYIKYTVRDATDEIKTFVELLDNETVYRPATYDDLGPTLEIIVDGRKVYLVAEITGGLEVTLPVIGTYSFKQTASARIKIDPPTTEETTDPWYVRVTNGQFFANVSGTLYKYYIAEFLNQVFVPEPPIKISSRELCNILSDNLIKVDHENLYEDEALTLHIDIEINSSDETGLAAFTTNPAKVGNIGYNGVPYVEWDEEDRVGIRSVDHLTGIIDVEGIKLKSTYEVEATYYYQETSYEFTLVDFNPISNKEALRYKTTLFIIPEDPATTATQTLYYLKTDESGKVVESNWSEFDNSAQEYNSKELYYEYKPSWKDGGHELGVDYHGFVNELSVEVSGVFLILGDMTVAEAQDASEVTQIDARRRGGGVIDTELENAKNLNPEAHWYWDEGYWDGDPYPGTASFLVEIPVDVMDGAGGRFQSKEIRDVVERHTAAGVYPCCRTYGVDITVSGIEPGEKSITLRWDSHEY